MEIKHSILSMKQKYNGFKANFFCVRDCEDN